MSFIKDMAATNLLVEAKFYNKTTTMTNGVPSSTYSESPDLTVDVLFWIGAKAERQVSEKFRPDVAGLISMDYEDYKVTINENAKVEINGVTYSVIYVDNIANQNQVIQIPVKRF
jgi:hypothetical protein